MTACSHRDCPDEATLTTIWPSVKYGSNAVVPTNVDYCRAHAEYVASQCEHILIATLGTPRPNRYVRIDGPMPDYSNRRCQGPRCSATFKPNQSRQRFCSQLCAKRHHSNWQGQVGSKATA